MRKDGKPPVFNKRTFPFHELNYVVLHDEQEIWMKGSFALGMGRQQIEKEHCAGYKLCLASRETIDKLKADPEYIKELKQIIKEREDVQDS